MARWEAVVDVCRGLWNTRNGSRGSVRRSGLRTGNRVPRLEALETRALLSVTPVPANDIQSTDTEYVIKDGAKGTGEIRGMKWNDANGNGIHDAGELGLANWRIYLDANNNQQYDATEVSTLTDNNGNYAFTGLDAGTYQVGEVMQTGWTQTYPGPQSKYKIQIQFSGATFTTAQQAAFNDAAARWSEVIVGDVPDVTINGVLVDDLLISASSAAIDGPGGILGQAGPTYLRPSSYLPAMGNMQFDTADLAAMEADGSLKDVILHEMGHVIGIGTIWSQLGLLTGAGTADPRFTGAEATAYYNLMFDKQEGGVPVENSGGAGTRDAHWRESVFGDELMTGWLSGSTRPLSKVTAASLADLGYEVYLNAADPFMGSKSGDGQGQLLNILPISPEDMVVLPESALAKTSDDKAGASGLHQVVLADAQIVRNIDFGNAVNPQISGSKWNDLNGNGIWDSSEPGLPNWQIYLDLNANGRRNTGEPTVYTDAQGHYTFSNLDPGIYNVGEVMQDGWKQTYPAATEVPDYEITLDFVSDLFTPSQIDVFQAAAARWAQIIYGDVPDVDVGGMTVDDLYIQADAEAIDGPGGILGMAGPDYIRPGSYLPATGMMIFDTADLAMLEAQGLLQDTITHEMGHVIGFGTIWSYLGLISGAGSITSRFVGPQATAEYDSIFGISATSVPLETTGGSGTADAHWRESIFDNELMTGYINYGDNPLSRITAASLADEGYEVDLDAADPYMPPLRSSQKAGYIAPLSTSPRILPESALVGNQAAKAALSGQHQVFVIPGLDGSNVDFGNVREAEIRGTIWNDIDFDGIRDIGEAALPQWTVYIDENANGALDAAEPVTTTNEFGTYAFTDMKAGHYVVRDVVLSGWEPTVPRPGERIVDLSWGQIATGVDFGNRRGDGTIAGNIWFDVDRDGIQDPEESGLPYGTVFLDTNQNGLADPTEASQATDEFGAYQFNELITGDYPVRVILPLGWVSTTPAAGFYSLKLTFRDHSYRADFGFRIQGAEISGTSFDDADGDGVQDPGEGPLGWRTFYVDSEKEGVMGQLDPGERVGTSNSLGYYSIKDLQPGTYRIREQMLDGWTQTYPAAGYYNVAVDWEGQAAGFNFGNRADTSKHELDINGDAQLGALDDGILMLRYMFDFRGNSLVRGISLSSTERPDVANVTSFLDSAKPTMLDVDGNGTVQPLVDGVMMMRYLADFRGQTLVRDLAAPNAVRTTPEAIAGFLDSYRAVKSSDAKSSDAKSDPRDTVLAAASEWHPDPRAASSIELGMPLSTRLRALRAKR